MRADANRIALRAVRTILDSATTVTLKVHGKDVECSLQPRAKLDWPKAVADLDPTTDGPWPSAAEFSCKWDGGQCVVRLSAELGSGGRYANNIFLRARVPHQSLIWINVRQLLGGAKTKRAPGRL